MKKTIVTLLILVLCFASCKKEVKTETETTTATDTIKTKQPVAEEPLDSVAQMKAWAAYATPGNPHKMMADEIGTWNCDMTFWSEANAKPQKATSTANIKMILGGRYQEANYQGQMMGQPFEGKSTLAYNNASKEYTTTFIDNMGTGMLVAVGKYDEKTKSTEFKGDMVNPLNGKKTPYREIYTIVDPKTRKMEMFDVKNGEEFKSMEIIMKKK
ncbi:DUF1579 domain-containing protein [Flavobacterium sp. ANB]|uniref:DUF1579 domain-containing protein n=1 Tax=unclassified Flavobacterium TaxID=196869 RepID=UPI0012B91AA2|nr:MULTISPECIES: DUF1579 domain-containing protein [unclassified Flavobacterium]MBF4517034.1 DUF1579 domain-containing protein [Flavobacterium sp. ANB]MTD71771.1 DUF1579 domain-containing protein [Flavobacterium sp. LC2016-13]